MAVELKCQSTSNAQFQIYQEFLIKTCVVILYRLYLDEFQIWEVFFWTDFILQKGQKYFTSQAENIVFDNQSNLQKMVSNSLSWGK